MNPSPAGVAAPQPPFRDRADAGRLLAQSLTHYHSEAGVVVLGLARGGVPVAREIAFATGAPFGVLTTRRIGVPGLAEVALGAIAEGSRRFVASAAALYIGVPQSLGERIAAGERVELERRASLYRAAHAFPDLQGRTVVLVDDGIATGATLRAAVRSVRTVRPRRVVAAVPIATRWGADEVRAEADELVVLITPPGFELIGRSYADYRAVTDDDVLALLRGPTRRVSITVRDISERLGRAIGGADQQPWDQERAIVIPVDGGVVAGDLGMPPRTTTSGGQQPARRSRGLAVLASLGASGRNNYRERYLAGRLRLDGYATLRLDLLATAQEHVAVDGSSFGTDVERLAKRLADTCAWAGNAGIAGSHRTILIGSGIAGAVALVAAARRPDLVWSVVTRAARVDLAGNALMQVRAQVLLIAGAADRASLSSNAEARRRLPRGARLLTVPHVGQQFDEPGALGTLGEHVMSWLERLETTVPATRVPQPRQLR